MNNFNNRQSDYSHRVNQANENGSLERPSLQNILSPEERNNFNGCRDILGNIEDFGISPTKKPSTAAG